MKSQIRAAWKLTAGAFLLVILLAPPVAGQTPTASSPSRQSIELMVGHGRVLHLDEAAESVYVGDTAIADLRIVAPDVVYVYGRKIDERWGASPKPQFVPRRYSLTKGNQAHKEPAGAR